MFHLKILATNANLHEKNQAGCTRSTALHWHPKSCQIIAKKHVKQGKRSVKSMIPELVEIWLCPASPALLNQVLPESDASRTPLEFFSALSSKGVWFVNLGILTTTAGTAELIAVCFTAALAEKYGAFTEAQTLSDDQADALKRSIHKKYGHKGNCFALPDF